MRRAIAFVLSFVLVFPPSFALPIPFSNKFGAAIGQLIANKAAARVVGPASGAVLGTAASAVIETPQYKATTEAASAVLSSAAAVLVAGVTMPVWASFAIGAAAGIAIPLAVDGVTKWAMNANGSVTVSGSSGAAPSGSFNPGIWRSGYDGCTGDRPVDVAACRGALNSDANQIYSNFVCDSGTDRVTCYGDINLTHPGPSDPASYPHEFLGTYQLISPGGSTGCVGFVFPGGGCQSYSDPGPAGGGTSTSTKSLKDAISDIPVSERSKPVNPKILADAANKTWEASSARPGTIPFDASNPITENDVQGFFVGNAANYPSVADSASSIANPATGGVSVSPAAVGGAVTAVGTGTTAQSVPTTATGTVTTATGEVSKSFFSIDWGRFEIPEMESPTVESILDPIFNLWPAWKNFAFPPHSSQCPAPQLDLIVIPHTLTFDHVCIWAEKIREPLQAIFSVAWSLTIVFIVMGA